MFPMSQCGFAPFEVLPATPAVAIVRNLIVGTPLNVLGSCSWTWEHRVWWSRMFHVLVNIVLKSNFDARLVPACPDSYALRIQPTRCQFWLFRFHDARNNMNRLAPNVHPMYSRILFFSKGSLNLQHREDTFDPTNPKRFNSSSIPQRFSSWWHTRATSAKEVVISVTFRHVLFRWQLPTQNAKIESLGGYSYIVAVDCDLFHGSGEPIGGGETPAINKSNS